MSLHMHRYMYLSCQYAEIEGNKAMRPLCYHSKRSGFGRSAGGQASISSKCQEERLMCACVTQPQTTTKSFPIGKRVM